MIEKGNRAMKTIQAGSVATKLWSIDSLFYGSLIVLILMYYFGFKQTDLEIILYDSLRYSIAGKGGERNYGYPMFIRLTKSAFGLMEGVVYMQLVLSAAAYAFLGWCIYKVFHAPILALVLVFMLISHPHLAFYQSAIMTESLSITLLCVMMGALMLLLAKPSVWLAAVSAFACGLAFSIKAANISLLPIWPILLWFIWRRCDGKRISVIAAIVVPITLCLLADKLVWPEQWAGTTRNDLNNLQLFAKVLMIEPDPVELDGAGALSRFVETGREIMAPARKLIDQTPDHWSRRYFLAVLENRAQVEYSSNEQLVRSAQEARRQLGLDSWSPQILGLASWPVLTNNPVAWLKNAAAHYWSLWNGISWDRKGFPPAAAERYKAFIKDELLELRAEYPYASSLFDRSNIATTQEHYERIYHWRLMLGFCASLLSLAFAVLHRMRRSIDVIDNRIVAAGLAGLMIHGNYLMIGLFNAASHRYTLNMFPLLAVCCLLTIDWVWETLRARLAIPFPYQSFTALYPRSPGDSAR